jgi:methyl-accepting chemotaxis protein
MLQLVVAVGGRGSTGQRRDGDSWDLRNNRGSEFIAMAVASAVGQQGAVTTEIARNAGQTAKSARDVTRNIDGVSRAATETGSAAGLVLSAACDVSRQAGQLTTEVGSFIADVRAA